jgi:hypothetical protein
MISKDSDVWMSCLVIYGHQIRNILTVGLFLFSCVEVCTAVMFRMLRRMMFVLARRQHLT